MGSEVCYGLDLKRRIFCMVLTGPCISPGCGQVDIAGVSSMDELPPRAPVHWCDERLSVRFRRRVK